MFYMEMSFYTIVLTEHLQLSWLTEHLFIHNHLTTRIELVLPEFVFRTGRLATPIYNQPAPWGQFGLAGTASET